MIAQTPVVLWDLDGTILDPAGAITEGIADALWTCGFPVPENLERFVGPPIGESLRHFTEVPGDQIPQVVSVYRAGYLTEGLQRTRVYPGIERELGRLQGLGVRQAVATQKPERIATEVVERFGLADYFETVSGAADDLAQPKEGRTAMHDKPEIIGEALRRLRVRTRTGSIVWVPGGVSDSPVNSTNCAWRWSVLPWSWQHGLTGTTILGRGSSHHG